MSFGPLDVCSAEGFDSKSLFPFRAIGIAKVLTNDIEVLDSTDGLSWRFLAT